MRVPAHPCPALGLNDVRSVSVCFSPPSPSSFLSPSLPVSPLRHTNTHTHVGRMEKKGRKPAAIMTPMFHCEPNAEYFVPLFLLFGIFLIFFFLEHILTL